MTKNNKDYWIFGKHPFEAVYKNKKRAIYKILYTNNTKEFLDKTLAKSNHIPTEMVDNKVLDKLNSGNFSPHQGIAIKTEELQTINLKDFLSTAKSNQKIIALDQITDPQNIGAIIRSAVALGEYALLVTDNAVHSPSVIRSSVGTSEVIDIIYEANLSRSLQLLQKNGFWVAGLDGYANDDVITLKNYEKLVIVLGSEGDGIRQLTKKNCDILVKIPMTDRAESLNVSNAAAIAMYCCSL